jgi:YfiH family protein
MLQKEKQGICWFEFKILQAYPKLRHAVFTKNSSTAPDAFAVLGIDQQVTTVFCNQVHGPYVHTLNTKPNGACTILSSDGLATNHTDTALVIKHADCQAAIFYDPVKESIAMVHSGWRGSCQNIYKNCIETLVNNYGSTAKDIIACISPSLGPNASEFTNYKRELPEEFYTFQIKPTYFDFWKISRWQLESLGIAPEHVEIAELCTYSDETTFFSYRRNRTAERHISVAWLSS